MPSNITATPDASTEGGGDDTLAANRQPRMRRAPIPDAPTLAEAAAARARQLASTGVQNTQNTVDDASTSEEESVDEGSSEGDTQADASPGSDSALLNILRSIPGTRQPRGEAEMGCSTGK